METKSKYIHNFKHLPERQVITQNKEVHFKRDLRHVIIEQTDSLELSEFVNEQVNLKEDDRILLTVGQRTYLQEEYIDNLRAFINLKMVNSISCINEYLFAVNKLLPDAGLFIGCVETYAERKARCQRTFKKIWFFVYVFDFLLNRVFARLRGLCRIYSFLTRDKIHLISKAEMLGRLVYSGFDIIDFKEIKGRLYYVAMKTKAPSTETEPCSHFVIKLPRIGKHGKIIGVYKLRTMHPYSQCIQDYVIKLNGYNEVGKPANDFRLASWGKILRKLWLDELPQILNVLLGQMKLVGVRPLSKARFNEFPKEVQSERILHKPACFPPYVALCMPDDKKNIEAEVIYFKERAVHPYTTDVKYFFMCIRNILFNKIRSS